MTPEIEGGGGETRSLEQSELSSARHNEVANFIFRASAPAFDLAYTATTWCPVLRVLCKESAMLMVSGDSLRLEIRDKTREKIGRDGQI